MAEKTRSKARSLVLILVCDPKEHPFFGGVFTGLLGTTNSAVAVMEGQTPKIIENAEGL